MNELLIDIIYSARFLALLSKRKTVDGIWFLILIAYVYTADTCLNLLRCVQVDEPVDFEGKQVSNHTYIKFYVFISTNNQIIRCTTLMGHSNVLMETTFRME